MLFIPEILLLVIVVLIIYIVAVFIIAAVIMGTEMAFCIGVCIFYNENKNLRSSIRIRTRDHGPGAQGIIEYLSIYAGQSLTFVLENEPAGVQLRARRKSMGMCVEPSVMCPYFPFIVSCHYVIVNIFTDIRHAMSHPGAGYPEAYVHTR